MAPTPPGSLPVTDSPCHAPLRNLATPYRPVPPPHLPSPASPAHADVPLLAGPQPIRPAWPGARTDRARYRLAASARTVPASSRLSLAVRCHMFSPARRARPRPNRTPAEPRPDRASPTCPDTLSSWPTHARPTCQPPARPSLCPGRTDQPSLFSPAHHRPTSRFRATPSPPTPTCHAWSAPSPRRYRLAFPCPTRRPPDRPKPRSRRQALPRPHPSHPSRHAWLQPRRPALMNRRERP
jgi:hypothetical protein